MLADTVVFSAVSCSRLGIGVVVRMCTCMAEGVVVGVWFLCCTRDAFGRWGMFFQSG